jgi:hypothetical protein
MYEQDQNVGCHFFAVKRFARRGKCLDDGRDWGAYEEPGREAAENDRPPGVAPGTGAVPARLKGELGLRDVRSA